MIPNNFVMKLRKYIKNNKIIEVKQIGLDRIVYFKFGKGGEAWYLFFEFFAKGNIILTDEKFKIILIYRHHKVNDDLIFKVGLKYPYVFDNERKKISLLSRANFSLGVPNDKKKISIFNLISQKYPHYGNDIIKHCLINLKMNKKSLLNEKTVKEEENIVNQFISFNEQILKIEKCGIGGYIYFEKKNEKYHSFSPFLLNSLLTEKFDCKKFDNFMDCVDDYYSKIESDTIELKKKKINNNITKRLVRLKKDYNDKILNLQNKMGYYEKCARIVTNNTEVVDKAINLINAALNESLNWDEIKRIIKETENPITKIIKRMNFEKNEITLLLNNIDENKNELVSVDTSMSSFGNVQHFFSLKKKLNHKYVRSIEVSEKAIGETERKAKLKLEKLTNQVKADIKKFKKRFWFEKFNWFVTSENYLVLSGRDAQTNELLVKRYMRKSDIYVHADYHGASSSIIKNPNNLKVTEATLREAATMTVCRSKAFSEKIIANAYWVYSHQVSKTAESGEYLKTGSFMIRGKKNFINPYKMIIGVGILFRLGEESMKNHAKERKVKEIIDDKSTKMKKINMDKMIDDILGQEIKDESDMFFRKSNIQKTEQIIIVEKDEVFIDNNDINNKFKEDILEDNKDDDEEELDDEEENDSLIFKEENYDYHEKENYKKEGEKKKKITEKKINWDELTPVEQRKLFNKKDKKKLKKIMKKGVKLDEAIKRVVELKIKSNIEKPKPKPKLQPKPEIEEILPNKKNDRFVPRKRKEFKTKKKWKKYKDQDEDERKIRMMLLGISSEKNKNKNKPMKNDNIKLLNYKKKNYKKPNMNHKNIEISKERKEWELSEEVKKISEIDSVTGIPREEDVLLSAHAVVAPFETLQDYKYRVKLIPGNNKRGIIVKQCLSMLQSKSKKNERENQLIRSVNHNILSLIMLDHVRIINDKITKEHPRKRP